MKDRKIEVPGYEVLDKIGEGGRGTVYRARQLSLDRLVAIKILWPHLATDSEYTRNFLHEAQAAAKLSHPNIVQAIEAGVHHGVWYFVMELVEGGSLHERLVKIGKMSERETIHIARQMVQALDFAWRRAGIIHRDIKPANILLTLEGQAKLADLGLARRHGTPAEKTGLTEGTPQYCSPEQCRADPNLDIRTDLYALGATLYHMVCGRPTFDGPDPAQVMAMQISQTPEPPRKLNKNLSKDLESLILKLLAKNPEERYQSPVELLKEVDKLRAREQAKRASKVDPSRTTAGGRAPGASTSIKPMQLLVRIAVSALVGMAFAFMIFLAVTLFHPDWISNKSKLGGLKNAVQQATNKVSHVVAPPIKPRPPRPPQTLVIPSTTGTETNKVATTEKPPEITPPPATNTVASTNSQEAVKKLYDDINAMMVDSKFAEAETAVNKAIEQWGDNAQIRTELEKRGKEIQSKREEFEKTKKAEDEAKKIAETARLNKVAAQAQGILVPSNSHANNFYFEAACQLVKTGIAKSSDSDLQARLQQRLDELQLLADLKGHLISTIKKNGVASRSYTLTRGTRLQGRPVAADADNLSIAVAVGSIDLHWSDFTESTRYELVKSVVAANDGNMLASMALFALESNRKDEAKRYYEAAKKQLGGTLVPEPVKRRFEPQS